MRSRYLQLCDCGSNHMREIGILPDHTKNQNVSLFGSRKFYVNTSINKALSHESGLAHLSELLHFARSYHFP